MYHYIKCPSCNNSIGEYYQLFLYLKQKKFDDLNINTSISNYQFDENIQISFEDIFELLHLNKICCRKSMITYIEFHSLFLLE